MLLNDVKVFIVVLIRVFLVFDKDELIFLFIVINKLKRFILLYIFCIFIIYVYMIMYIENVDWFIFVFLFILVRSLMIVC